MRKLENKTINIKLTLTKQFTGSNEVVVAEQLEEATYFKLLHSICKVPPAKGWNLMNIDALKTRMELVDKLTKNDLGSIQLEETHYKSLTEALGENGGTIMFTSQESLDFLNYLKNLPEDK